AGAALEEHVVGHDHRGAAVDLQDRLHVLHEVELLVARGGPEVLARDGEGLAGLIAVLGHTSTLDFFPKGGFVSTIAQRVPGSAARLSAVVRAGAPSSALGPMPWSMRFIAQSLVTAGTSSTPCRASSLRCFFCSRVRLGWFLTMKSCVASRKPPVPHAGSQ